MVTVHFIGAGASSTAGPPTIREFRSVADAVEAKFASSWPASGRVLFRQALDRWTQVLHWADVEEFYVLADLLDKLERPIPLQLPPGDVLYMIGRTLEHATDPARLGGHTEFLRNHVLRNGPEQNIVITPNWDTVLERAGLVISGVGFDYGASNAKTLHRAPTKEVDTRVTYLKLHGSYDWLSCVRCETHWLADTSFVLTLLEGSGQIECPACYHDHVRPVVVPPVSEKFPGTPYSSMVLAQVWRRAVEALRACAEIRILGYSLPKTDVQLRLLLVKTLSENPNTPRIVVVSRPKPESEERDFKRHWLASMGPELGPRLEFRFKTFADWASEAHQGP